MHPVLFSGLCIFEVFAVLNYLKMNQTSIRKMLQLSMETFLFLQTDFRKNVPAINFASCSLKTVFGEVNTLYEKILIPLSHQ